MFLLVDLHEHCFLMCVIKHVNMCILSGRRAECNNMNGLDEENMSNSSRTYTSANQRNAPPTYTDTVSLYIIHLLTMNIYLYIPSTGTCNCLYTINYVSSFCSGSHDRSGCS